MSRLHGMSTASMCLRSFVPVRLTDLSTPARRRTGWREPAERRAQERLSSGASFDLRSCSMAPRQMPAMTKGIDTCAATQKRSNCACTRRHSTTATASVPKRGSTCQSTTSTPIHITMNPRAPRPRRSPAPPARPAGAGSPVPPGCTSTGVRDRRWAPHASSGRPRGTSRAVGTPNCAGSATAPARRPSTRPASPPG